MSLPRIARLAAVGATLLVAGLGCSGNTKRDQFYGTDVGADWIPPDATLREASAAHDGGAGDAADAGDALPGDASGDSAADAGDDGAPSADAPTGDTF
jgi:hypothetical protein